MVRERVLVWVKEGREVGGWSVHDERDGMGSGREGWYRRRVWREVVS